MNKKNFLMLISAISLSCVIAGCSANTEQSTNEVTEENNQTEETATQESDTQDTVPSTDAAVIYITLDEGDTFQEFQVDSTEAITPEYLINCISTETGWNLELSDSVTSGKGGMTISFAETSTFYVGVTEPQIDAYRVDDDYQLYTSILSSIQHTLQQNYVDESLGGDPSTLDIYFCGPNDTELYLESIDATVPFTEPYNGIKMN